MSEAPNSEICCDLEDSRFDEFDANSPVNELILKCKALARGSYQLCGQIVDEFGPEFAPPERPPSPAPEVAAEVSPDSKQRKRGAKSSSASSGNKRVKRPRKRSTKEPVEDGAELRDDRQPPEAAVGVEPRERGAEHATDTGADGEPPAPCEEEPSSAPVVVYNSHGLVASAALFLCVDALGVDRLPKILYSDKFPFDDDGFVAYLSESASERLRREAVLYGKLDPTARARASTSQTILPSQLARELEPSTYNEADEIETAAYMGGVLYCTHCGIPACDAYRMVRGPDGPHTLCNACAISYHDSGFLPEARRDVYRHPLESCAGGPTEGASPDGADEHAARLYFRDGIPQKRRELQSKVHKFLLGRITGDPSVARRRDFTILQQLTFAGAEAPLPNSDGAEDGAAPENALSAPVAALCNHEHFAVLKRIVHEHPSFLREWVSLHRHIVDSLEGSEREFSRQIAGALTTGEVRRALAAEEQLRRGVSEQFLDEFDTCVAVAVELPAKIDRAARRLL